MNEAVFGAGCFWCIEAVFQQIKGIKKIESGYMGGKIKNPAYREVCTGLTGHAEVVKITFDPEVISFKEMLEIFWKTHDPTTLNRQGADKGTQYRSVIFYMDEDQKKLALAYKKKLNDENVFDNPVVTEISPASAFYVAEEAHQNYYNQNSNQPYCSFVVKPKVDKVKKLFAEKLV
ncbi:MAG TPA: peptide-methionine (S)-S-oxide reductase MsrA [Fulvivirga sp.]|nr:peptide-methionine (S)-S-oxide reductase MsrA [Fulvivirga sp.]